MRVTRRETLKAIAGIGAANELFGDHSISNFFSNWSLTFARAPHDFLDPEATTPITRLDTWTDNVEYRLDPLNGLYDQVSPVAETVRTQKADCTDYAATAASFLLYYETNDIDILYSIPTTASTQGHVTVQYDGHMVDVDGVFKNRNAESFLRERDQKLINRETIQNTDSTNSGGSLFTDTSPIKTSDRPGTGDCHACNSDISTTD